MSPKTMKFLAKPMLFAAALIWGTSFFIMKNALDAVPVFFLLAIRFTAGAVLLALAAWKRWRSFSWDYLWRGAAIGGFLFLAYSIQTFGLALTTPSKNAFLTAVYCVIVPFLAWAVIRSRPDRYNIIAALLCVTGVGLVSLTEGLTINTGDLLTLVCAIFYAAHIVAVAKVSPGKDITLLTVFQFAFAGLYAWICGAFTETFPAAALAEPKVFLPMIYLCVMATTVALLFQNVGMVWSDPASASVILSLESVFGVLFSVLFYKDPVTGRLLAGFGLIFVAVVCSETKFSFLARRTLDMKKLAKPMLFAAAFFWGASFMLMKDTLDSIPTGHLIAIRFTVGALLVALTAWRRWKGFSRDYLWRGGLAGLMLFGVYWAQTVGLETTTASNSAFLSAVYCVIVPFLAWAVDRLRPDWYDLAAAGLCIVGVGLVSLTQALTITSGDLYTLLGAVFCAANIVAVAKLGRGKDVMLLTVVQLVTVGSCAWALALCTETFDFASLGRPEVLWSMLYLCVIATAACLALMNLGLVWSEPSAAALILSLEAVFGVALAVIFQGDPLTPRLLAGFALIFLGVVCSETKFTFLRKKR